MAKIRRHPWLPAHVPDQHHQRDGALALPKTQTHYIINYRSLCSFQMRVVEKRERLCFRRPGNRQPASSHPASGTRHSRTRHAATQRPAPGTPVSGPRHRARGTRHPNTRHPAPRRPARGTEIDGVRFLGYYLTASSRTPTECTLIGEHIIQFRKVCQRILHTNTQQYIIDTKNLDRFQYHK